MAEARILEESENLKMQRMATVRTARGDEFVINVDEAVKALANLFSDYDNEIHFGWSLQEPWYSAEFCRLRRAALQEAAR